LLFTPIPRVPIRCIPTSSKISQFRGTFEPSTTQLRPASPACTPTDQSYDSWYHPSCLHSHRSELCLIVPPPACTPTGQSCVSFYKAIAPAMRARWPGFSMKDVARDCVHPSHGEHGNAYLTDILVHWLAPELLQEQGNASTDESFTESSTGSHTKSHTRPHGRYVPIDNMRPRDSEQGLDAGSSLQGAEVKSRWTAEQGLPPNELDTRVMVPSRLVRPMRAGHVVNRGIVNRGIIDWESASLSNQTSAIYSHKPPASKTAHGFVSGGRRRELGREDMRIRSTRRLPPPLRSNLHLAAGGKSYACYFFHADGVAVVWRI
jgi:hypothetical protein